MINKLKGFSKVKSISNAEQLDELISKGMYILNCYEGVAYEGEEDVWNGIIQYAEANPNALDKYRLGENILMASKLRLLAHCS